MEEKGSEDRWRAKHCTVSSTDVDMMLNQIKRDLVWGHKSNRNAVVKEREKVQYLRYRKCSAGKEGWANGRESDRSKSLRVEVQFMFLVLAGTDSGTLITR